MTLRVKRLCGGAPLCIDGLTSLSTIGQVKRAIEHMGGPPAAEQRLVWAGRVLNDDDTLELVGLRVWETYPESAVKTLTEREPGCTDTILPYSIITIEDAAVLVEQPIGAENSTVHLVRSHRAFPNPSFVRIKASVHGFPFQVDLPSSVSRNYKTLRQFLLYEWSALPTDGMSDTELRRYASSRHSRPYHSDGPPDKKPRAAPIS